MLKRRFSALVIITILLTLGLLMLGAYTRLSDSGLGCPDWPSCYGKLSVGSITEQHAKDLFPNNPLNISKAWIEMLHRYLASIVGFLVLLIAITATYQRVRSKNYSEARPLILPIFILALTIFQGLLGMWTVTKMVFPVIVTAHLLGGVMILALLYLLHLNLINPYASPKRYIKSFFLILLVVLQILLGGWVSTNYSALSCTSFPGCYSGSFLPSMNFSQAFYFHFIEGLNYEGGVLSADARATINMTHRVGALIVLIYSLYLFFSFVDHAYKKLRTAAWILLLAVIIQVSIGIANVYLKLPLWLAVLHNGFAALLLLSAVNLWFFSKKPDY